MSRVPGPEVLLHQAFTLRGPWDPHCPPGAQEESDQGPARAVLGKEWREADGQPRMMKSARVSASFDQGPRGVMRLCLHSLWREA